MRVSSLRFGVSEKPGEAVTKAVDNFLLIQARVAEMLAQPELEARDAQVQKKAEIFANLSRATGIRIDLKA